MAKPKPPIWRNDSNGLLYHEECFTEGESKEGFSAVKDLNELEMDDTCESCGGAFLSGLDADDTGDDDEDEDDD